MDSSGVITWLDPLAEYVWPLFEATLWIGLAWLAVFIALRLPKSRSSTIFSAAVLSLAVPITLVHLFIALREMYAISPGVTATLVTVVGTPVVLVSIVVTVRLLVRRVQGKPSVRSGI